MPDINNEEAFTPIEIEGGVVEQETFQDKRLNQMGNMVSLDASPYEQWSSLSEGNPLRELLTGSGDMRERDEFVTRIKDVKEVDIEALFDSIGEQYNGGGANELYDKAYGEQDVDELIESIPSQHELSNEFVREMGIKTTEDEFAEMIDEIPSYKDISDEFAKEMGLDDDIKNAIGRINQVPTDFIGMKELGLKATDKNNMRRFLMDSVKLAEGGYSTDVKDRGNYNDKNVKGTFVGTNHGVSAPVLSKELGRDATAEDMKALTKEKAEDILMKRFYDKPRLNALPPELQEIVYNGVVNSEKHAIKVMQTLLGVEPDGIVGEKTEKAMRKAKFTKVQFKDALLKKYKTFNTWNVHGKGWTNRFEKLAKD